jgi:hypothetical protein
MRGLHQFETSSQLHIRREFPSSRKRGFPGNREGCILVAANSFGLADASSFVLVGDPARIHLVV